MRNVEIKAKIRDLTFMINKAKNISGSNGTLILQNDTFYNVPKGRFKLRKFENGNAEVMYYERPDTIGPKTCTYDKCSISANEVKGLSTVLENALGTAGIVKKRRHLFLVGQTRIHVDEVEGLGNFMELEVVLEPHQSEEEGEKMAYSLMDKLGVPRTDLISGAYRDMLCK